MKRMVSVLLFAVLSVGANVAANERLLLGDHQSEIKSHVVSECQKLTSPDEIKACLVQAGDSVSKVNSAIASEHALAGIDGCLKKTKSLENSWFYFLNCATRQIELWSKNPLPELALMEFKIDEYRAVWLLSCRKESSTTLSRCLAEKESEFNAFWLQYLGLSRQPNRAPAFARCLEQEELSPSQFKRVNKCLSLNQQ